MKLFEELMDKTAKFADEAVKVGKEAFEQTKVVAGEAAEKGKKKVRTLQLEADMKDAFRKLGEEVYIQYKNGVNDSDLLAAFIEKIGAIEKELEELKMEVVNEEADYTVTEFKEEIVEFAQEIKEETAEAAEEIKEEMREAVEEVKEAVADFTEKDVRVCPGCGAKADEDDIFCRECGNKLI